MKQFPAMLFSFLLFVSFQPYRICADIFSKTHKNIRIEVIDCRDFSEDIIFWIHHTKDTPVIAQKLINNGMYPISITIYNESDMSIKIIKNALGGLSTVEDHEVAKLYQHNIFARVGKKAALGTSVALVAVEVLNMIAGGRFESIVEQLCGNWYAKIKYGVSSLSGLCAGVMHWSEAATTNTLISQAFKSQMLPEELILGPDCSVSFLLFASHAPSGYTLTVPIFDEQDNQITSFLCPFATVIAA